MPSIGPALHYSILERDEFACWYCGRRPPDVVLHVDHIQPRSQGGTNARENLLTACARCNLGKGTGEVRTPEEWERIRDEAWARREDRYMRKHPEEFDAESLRAAGITAPEKAGV